MELHIFNGKTILNTKLYLAGKSSFRAYYYLTVSVIRQFQIKKKKQSDLISSFEPKCVTVKCRYSSSYFTFYCIYNYINIIITYKSKNTA